MTAVGTEFHLRVQEILEQAASLRPRARTRCIRRACGGSTRLLREVQSLLPHYESMRGFEPQTLGCLLPGSTTCARVVKEAEAAGSQVDEEQVQPPFCIDQYETTDLIGRGGMALVYRAVARAGNRCPVAIKLLRRALLAPEMRQRFEFEAQLVRQLSHPGIARILHAGVASIQRATADGPVYEDRPYYVMEYIEGRPLIDYADAQELGARARLALLVNICEALQYAHSQGVIHRDLKPDNILVDRSGQPKLLDFGIARHLEYQATVAPEKDGRFLGTPEYASPEQLAGRMETLSARSDVYSVGLIGHELLTGRLPTLAGGRLRLSLRGVQVDDGPNSRRLNQAEFRYYLAAIFTTALARIEDRRYATAGEFGVALQRLLDRFAPLTRWSFFKRRLAQAFASHAQSEANSLSRPLTAVLGKRVALTIESDEFRAALHDDERS